MKPDGAAVEERGARKHNGPKPAAWLRANREWRVVLESSSRNGAAKAACKISSGSRAGFVKGMYEARAALRGGRWTVEARYAPPRQTKAKSPSNGKGPLF